MVRACLSGTVLLARSLLSGREADLADVLRSVMAVLPVPVTGVISDGQHPIRKAVKAVLPHVPRQLCQVPYLREAAKPVYEADRHAKKAMKKQVRGVRPIERQLEGRDDEEAEAARGSCLAVRRARTDDGRPPRCASGLTLRERLRAIQASIARVAGQRGGCRRNWSSATGCSAAAWAKRRSSGPGSR